MSPPKVYFLTKIYHPNIHWDTGEVCLDILKSEWSTMWSLSKIGKALSSLLFDPNAESPLNCDAGRPSSPRQHDPCRRHAGLRVHCSNDHSDMRDSKVRVPETVRRLSKDTDPWQA